MISWITLILMLFLVFPLKAEAADVYYGRLGAGTDISHLSFADVASHWARSSIYRLAALGVLRSSGPDFRPEAYATKEEALGMVVRLAGKEGEAQKLAVGPGEMASYRTPWGANYTRLAQNMGIVTPAERASANWQAPATREEVAYWIARMSGLAPVYDSEQHPVYSFQDWARFSSERIPYCATVVKLGIMSGRDAGMFYPQASIRRGELAAALDKASRIILAGQGYKELSGTVVRVSSGGQADSADTYVQVAQNDGLSFYVIAGSDKEVFVYDRTSGKTGLSGLLTSGDQVSVLVTPQKLVAYIEKRQVAEASVSGYLDYVDSVKRIVRATASDGKSYELAVSPLCKISLSGYPARMNDLVPGQPVVMLVSGSQVSEIRGDLPDSLTSGEVNGTRVVYGTLFTKTAGEISIRDENGNPYTYSLTSETDYYVGGVVSTYYSLKTGDYLKLTVDSQGNVIRVDVRKDAGDLAVYRGYLDEVKAAFSTVRFTDIYRYENGDLVKETSAAKTLKLASGAELFAGSNRLSAAQLEAYRGRYAFVVTSIEGGEERIVRLVVRGDSERRINGKVEELDAYRDCMTVKYEPALIQYDQSTIAVKDNRLVDPDMVQAGDMVTVLAERKDNSSVLARVIVIEGTEEARYTIGKGVLDEVLSRSSIQIDSLDCLENNEWDYVGSNREYYYDALTYIVLATSSSVRELNAEEFYNLDEDLEEDDILFIAEGDRILALLVTDGIEFSNEIITKGAVISLDSGSITVGSVTNWSGFTEKWVAQSDNLTVKTKYALVVKKGQGGSASKLATKDAVYLLRASVGGERDVYAEAILVE
ncbi:MAG: S-layer homology domain-containing protein [Syntrophothermus sp.]|nr:S-layer homology domain-containing protein [Syntrophothermus sp.]